MQIECTCGETFEVIDDMRHLPISRWDIGSHRDCIVPRDIHYQVMSQFQRLPAESPPISGWFDWVVSKIRRVA